MKNLIFLAVLFIFLTGCFQMEDLGSKNFNKSGDVSTLIFQSEYTNYAWGYNHNGWIMDNSGKVNRFQKKGAWVFPDSLGYISATDMQKNFGACDSAIAQISVKDFSFYAEKALTCADGPMTKPKNTMADAGENILCFYVFEVDKKRYKRIILSMIGDWSQENLAPNAKEVVDWMGKIK